MIQQQFYLPSDKLISFFEEVLMKIDSRRETQKSLPNIESITEIAYEDPLDTVGTFTSSL